MGNAQMVNFQLAIADAEASQDELRAVVRAVAAGLEEQGAEVAAIGSRGNLPGRVSKGGGSEGGSTGSDSGGSILNVEINLENIVAFGRWLRDRLVGTTTKVKFEYKEATFEFDGRDEEQLAVAMAGFERFVATIDDRPEQAG